MQKLCRVIGVIAVLSLAVGCGGKGGKVVANVNGQKITSDELTFSIQELARAGRPVDEAAKKKVLEQLVFKSLLMGEADRLGITKDEIVQQRIDRERERIILDELVRREINMFLSVPDEEVKQAYDKEVGSIKGKKPSFEEAKGQIRQQLIKQKQTVAFNNIITNLRSKATISIDDAALSAIRVASPAPSAPPK